LLELLVLLLEALDGRLQLALGVQPLLLSQLEILVQEVKPAQDLAHPYVLGHLLDLVARDAALAAEDVGQVADDDPCDLRVGAAHVFFFSGALRRGGRWGQGKAQRSHADETGNAYITAGAAPSPVRDIRSPWPHAAPTAFQRSCACRDVPPRGVTRATCTWGRRGARRDRTGRWRTRRRSRSTIQAAPGRSG